MAHHEERHSPKFPALVLLRFDTYAVNGEDRVTGSGAPHRLRLRLRAAMLGEEGGLELGGKDGAPGDGIEL